MPADRSQTERIRRLKGQIQAVRRAECPTCPEEGPRPPTDESTRLSRSFGQMEYTRLNAVGARITTCCSSSTSAPPPGGGGIL